MRPHQWKRFTVVFEGDIRNLPFNPLKKESDWGRPIATMAGDALVDADDDPDEDDVILRAPALAKLEGKK